MKNAACVTFKGLLQLNTGTFRIITRNKRINVQKPRPPHYARAKLEALVRPKYFEKGERESWFLPRASTCLKEHEITTTRELREVDNPYERLLAKDLKNWFLNSKLIAFFHANPIRFDDRFEVEVRLRRENMYLKTLGRHTVNMAVEGTPYSSVMCLFNSHTDMVFCSEPKVHMLLKLANKMYCHTLLAAIVEDRFLNVNQLKALAQLKDLTTARTQLVSVLNAAQSQLVSGLTFHQSNIVAGLRQYADKQPESQHAEDDLSSSTSETARS